MSTISLLNTYSQSQLKDLKQRLEITHKARLSRHRPPNQVIICCRNPDCLFNFTYCEVAEDTFSLTSSFSMHLPTCELEDEEFNFQRNRKRILDMQQHIEQMYREREKEFGFESPGRILELLSEPGKVPFIYEGVTEQGSKRKLKKKFDNVVADAKRAVLKSQSPAPKTPEKPSPKATPSPSRSASTDIQTPPPLPVYEFDEDSLNYNFFEVSAQALPDLIRDPLDIEENCLWLL